MAREYCPECRAVKNVIVTVAEAEEQQPDGTVRKVRCEAVRCESCGAFIRSAALTDDADAE